MARTPPVTAARFIPARARLPDLRKAARGCTACPLYKTGTQTVFGEGPQTARLMLVGEQPGDVEDRTGRPFVGPAGKLLDRALADAGLDRARVYVTNVVKHFNGSSAASGASTSGRDRSRSSPASPGWRPRSPPRNRASSSASAPPRHRRCSAEVSA